MDHTGAASNRKHSDLFQFYISLHDEMANELKLCDPLDIPVGEEETSKAFHIWDSTGKIVPCQSPQDFNKAVSGKKILNWHIKQWAWTIRDNAGLGLGVQVGMLRELEQDMPSYPLWVWKAVWNQSQRK